MRISDWSSDVCSSDLHRHGLFVRRHRRVEPGPRVDHMLVVGERLVEARWKHRAELLIEIGDAELDALRLPHQYVDLLNGLLERVQFGEVDGGQIAGLIGQVRSEEHTSELQSLMRISYAVFCLK